VDEKTQAVQIHIAGADYPVEFEDAELSVTDRQRIVSDLIVPFSFVPSFGELKGLRIGAEIPLPNGGTSVTNIDGRDYWAGVYQPSIFSAEEPCPDILHGLNSHPCRRMLFWTELDGCFILDCDGKQGVLINKAFSCRYLYFLGLMDAHSEAIQKVKAFTALLNSPDLLSQPADVLRDLYCLISNCVDFDNPLSDDKLRDVFTNIQKRRHYLGITALSFLPEAPAEFISGGNPVFGMFAVSTAAADKGHPWVLFVHMIELRNTGWWAVQYDRERNQPVIIINPREKKGR